MYRDQYDQPYPASAAEITEALGAEDLLPEHARALLGEPNPNEDLPYRGGWAAIGEADSDGVLFMTIGFETREALETALREASPERLFARRR